MIPAAVLLAKLGASGLGALARAGKGLPTVPGAIPANPGADFQNLLKQAKQGLVRSDLPVSIAKNASVELSPEQTERLAQAADRAAAAGLTSALVVIDGQTLTLDVQTRTITGKFDAAPARVAHFDGVVTVPSPEQEAQIAVLQLPHGTLASDPSVSRMLDTLARASRGGLGQAAKV